MGAAVSVSNAVLNLGAIGLAAVTATYIGIATPFIQEPPAAIPAPVLPIVCRVYIPDDPGEPTQERCFYLDYPAEVVRIQSPVPL